MRSASRLASESKATIHLYPFAMFFASFSSTYKFRFVQALTAVLPFFVEHPALSRLGARRIAVDSNCLGRNLLEGFRGAPFGLANDWLNNVFDDLRVNQANYL